MEKKWFNRVMEKKGEKGYLDLLIDAAARGTTLLSGFLHLLNWRNVMKGVLINAFTVRALCDTFSPARGAGNKPVSTLPSHIVIDVEFLDLKICQLDGGDPISIWPGDGATQSLETQRTLRCLSRMLNDEILTDVTINTLGGTLRTHKEILSASSPVFQSMFLHDLKEKESSMVDIEDISVESCTALLSYFYGTIKQDDFWRHRLALLGAAHKYDIMDLKDACEESLLEDINSGNVLEKLLIQEMEEMEFSMTSKLLISS
ncbi:BTB/POZ domain-containing protein At1g21780-like [Papaver somniferum]|uniref:BTB/POZ domain-containing protein At1g21780-like n=1 Tax=Papaver somniferum TaxID=3469 RepID=UPI000E6F8D73|nr:BTB/POZ domain-containing protein At1g21780-like [Papaver somniferum]